ncbi:MAG: hypothetical protein ACRD9S_23380 [Pyrinomonadaceae bacterium]
MWRGCKQVYLFERHDRPFSTYETSARLIHPRLFEWPASDWNTDQAQIACVIGTRDLEKRLPINCVSNGIYGCICMGLKPMRIDGFTGTRPRYSRKTPFYKRKNTSRSKLSLTVRTKNSLSSRR